MALRPCCTASPLPPASRCVLCLQVVRKERAVGVVPTAATIYEVLEELAITVQVSRRLWGSWHGLMAAAHLDATCLKGGRGHSSHPRCCTSSPLVLTSAPSPPLAVPPPPPPQNQLQAELPFCAFNGGNDVFVDVGNKSLGLEALMNHLGCMPSEVGALPYYRQGRPQRAVVTLGLLRACLISAWQRAVTWSRAAHPHTRA